MRSDSYEVFSATLRTRYRSTSVISEPTVHNKNHYSG